MAYLINRQVHTCLVECQQPRCRQRFGILRQDLGKRRIRRHQPEPQPARNLHHRLYDPAILRWRVTSPRSQLLKLSQRRPLKFVGNLPGRRNAGQLAPYRTIRTQTSPPQKPIHARYTRTRQVSAMALFRIPRRS